jgi:hypothetical protein
VPVAISIKHDLKRIKRQLTAIEKQQLPFAASKALNEAAYQGAQVEKIVIKHKIDRPKPWTVSGLSAPKSLRSHKRDWPNLKASIIIADNRWKYMRFHVEGGVEPGRHIVPVNIRTNKFGSIGRGKLKKPGMFIRRIKGVTGVWQRVDKRNPRLSLLARFHPQASYRKRYPWGEAARKHAARNFSRYFDVEMRKALANPK